MRLIISSRVSKSLCGLLTLLAVAVPGRAFQIAEELTSATAVAPASVGGVLGVAKDPYGRDLAGARVTARSVNDTSERTVLSGSDGGYLIVGLKPGLYLLSARAEGFAAAKPATVEITQNQVAYANVDLGKAEAPPAAGEASVPESARRMPAAPAPSAESAMLTELAAMKARIEQLEAELKKQKNQPPGPAVETPALAAQPVRREPLVAAAAPVEPSLAPSPAPAPRPVEQATAAQAVPASAPAAPAVDLQTPFAFGDFTWLNGNPRNKDVAFDTPFFTPEIRFDTNYMQSFNEPRDHTLVGSTESYRSGEVQIEQISVGGDFHWQNVRGRVLYMDGMFATTTPRNDASSGVGQWDLRDAYRYVSEAYGGYHFNVNHGLNVDAGIFVSYIGLFSYYNFDNWTYQPSYVSSNTPWFFNGVRVQWFPTNKLKIEPWFINGWQSYAKYNGHPGLGGQILYRPKEWLSLVFNQYGFGQDNLGLPKTERIHTDDSIEVRYLNRPESLGVSKMALSFTVDAGCQYGGGIYCTGAASGPKDAFLGWMLYQRAWFHKDRYAITLGGGKMNNPGRYLTLLPPIDGADAVSGTPYFTENPGQPAHMYDGTITFQYMPKEYITWWAEAGYRHSDIPYFAGRGGVTPPAGNNGFPQYFTCMTGATSGTANLATAQAACGGASNVWFPDLRHSEAKVSLGVLVKF